MKKIKAALCVALCAALLLSLAACGKKEITKKDIVEGEKTVGQEIYEDEKLVGAEYYDENGEVNRKVEYDKDENIVLEETLNGGSTSGSTTYSYSDGEKVSSEQTVFGKDGEKRAVTVSYYHKDKVVSQTITSYVGGSENGVTERSYTYNDDGSTLKTEAVDGKPKSETLTSAAGEVLSEKTYNEDGSATKNCNEAGVLKRLEEYDTAGKKTAYTDYSYDTDGKISQTDRYNADGTKVMYSVYRYMDSKLYRIFMFDADGTLERYAAYDENGGVTMHDSVGNPLK